MLAIGFAASPALAADFEVENVKLDLGAYKVTAPKLQVKGSPLEREAFAALFAAGAGESASARMGRLTADEISAPELVVEDATGTETEITTYRDLRLSEVRGGRIARGETAGGTMAGAGASGLVSGEYRGIRFEGFDLRQLIRVLTERAAPGAGEPALPLYSLVEYDGGTLNLEGPAKLSYGKASDRGLKGKVGAASFAELMTTISREGDIREKTAGAPDLDDAEQLEADRRLRLAVLALLDMFEFGDGELRDLVISMPTPLDAELRVARIAYGAATPAKTGLAIEGLDFGLGAGTTRIAALKFTSLTAAGFAFTGNVKELKEVLAKLDSDEILSDWRRFVPKLGTLQIAGLSANIAFQLDLSIGSLEAKVSDQIDGIPTDLTVAIETLKVPLNEPVLLPFGNALTGLGYQDVSLSAKLDLSWQAASNEIAIRSLTLDSAGMGKVSVSGTLGNIDRDVFSSDPAVMQIAALGATAKALDIRLENTGLAERLLAEQANQGKRKPADVQREYAALTKVALPGLLGNSPSAKALIDAAARFVAKPGTVTVQARAKANAGLGLADVIAITDPREVFSKIDVTANAE